MALAGRGSSVLESIGQLFSVLAIFIIVLLVTYFVTRWIAGYQQSQMQTRNLRVIETLRLANNKYIQIIEAGDVYLVIALSRDRVEKLTELTKDQLKEISASGVAGKDAPGESFQEILGKVKEHFPKK